MRLLFAGTPETAVPTLAALADAGHDIVAVLTRPDARSGRGRTSTRSAVGTYADGLGIPLLQPRTVRDPEVHERLRELDLDAAAIVAYGGIVPPPALSIPRHGWINLHFSLLPRWRGAAPVQRAVAAGDTRTGVSTFLLEEGLDTGPVYRQRAIDVDATATSGELLETLAEIGAGEMIATFEDIAAGRQPSPQPPDGSTLAPKITVDEAQVDFRGSAVDTDRLIRAVTPDPGAWCLIGDLRVKLSPVTPVNDAEPLRPGEIVASKREMLVGTADGAVRLGTVQPPGKRPMPAADFARGARIDGVVVTPIERAG